LNPAIKVDPNGQIPTIYYGIRAIAQRLDVSAPTVFRWYWKYNLPMVQMSCKRKFSRIGWTWYTDETLLAAWRITEMELQRKRHMAQRAGARRETVRERRRHRGLPVLPEHLPPSDSK
jgi:hypothetical protein